MRAAIVAVAVLALFAVGAFIHAAPASASYSAAYRSVPVPFDTTPQGQVWCCYTLAWDQCGGDNEPCFSEAFNYCMDSGDHGRYCHTP